MKFALNIIEGLSVFKSLFSIFDNHILKTDEENLDILLSTPKDRIKFDDAVQELKSSSIKSKEIKLDSGKVITISI